MTVDAVIFGVDDKGLKILLIRRRDEPFKDYWALPGGFLDVDRDDNADDAVARELREETSLTDLYLEQLYTFSQKGRDPRERVVTVAYFGLVRPEALKPVAGDDAKEVKWFSVKRLPKLAFDHKEIVRTGLERLRAKVRYQPVGFELLPEEFTMSQLQHLYECLLGRSLDKRNFRKKIQATGVVAETEYVLPGKGRPATLYRFNAEEYRRKVQAGFNFEV
jgi:8-oxo-dGTP diphosphatase